MELAGAAGDGEEALELVSRLRPDVLLTELMLPKLDGDVYKRQAHGRPARRAVGARHARRGAGRDGQGID